VQLDSYNPLMITGSMRYRAIRTRLMIFNGGFSGLCGEQAQPGTVNVRPTELSPYFVDMHSLLTAPYEFILRSLIFCLFTPCQVEPNW
jgi:hypothetical protein